MANQKHFFLGKLVVWCVCALLVLPLCAQEKTSTQNDWQSNSISRILVGNYVSPAIRTIQLRGEGLLETMIRDGKLEITADDAVSLALANNVDINVLRYTPYMQLWGIEGGRAVLNPTIQFAPGINRNVTPSSSALQGGATSLTLANAYSMNIHKPFKFGGDFDFNYTTNRSRTNSVFSSLNPAISSLWSIAFTQHLLQGFGNVSRARFLHIARNNYDISVDNFNAGLVNIVSSVLSTYWNLVYSDEDIKVKESSLKLAQLTLEQAQVQLQVGTMAPLDVLQAQAQVASVNQQLVVSRYNRRIIEDQLKKQISSRSAASLMEATIVPTSRVQPPPPPVGTVTDAVLRAIEIRPEIKALQSAQANNRINVDYTKNQLRPVLDFTASYSQNGLGGDTIQRDYSKGFLNAPITAVVPGGYLDSLSSLFSGTFLGYAAGFTLKVPIGNDQARVNSAQAQIAYKQGEENLRALRQQITLQVRQAYDSVALNQASVEAAQIAVDYQEKRLQGEQDKYMLGAGTTFLVLQAQRDLQTAQGVLLQSKIAWIQSRVALDQAVGDTLTNHNIVLDDALNLPKK